MEKDNEIAGIGNHYTALFGEYDPRVVTRWGVDPMADERSWVSPYNAMQNNPINREDPTGALDEPIYSTKGELLGTDERGLTGNPIIMEEGKFEQGMKHENAMRFNLGFERLENEAAKSNFIESFLNLPSRPDYDGKLTLSEANDWYRTGGGKPLFVDASKIDLSPVYQGDIQIGKSKNVNFASPQYANFSTGLVYGTIRLTVVDANSVKLGGTKGLLDRYDFDYQKGRLGRNIATRIGENIAGKGTPYNIFNYGVGSFKKRPQIKPNPYWGPKY